MGFKKGQPRPATSGRKKGSQNKLTVGRRIIEAKAKEDDPDGMGHAYEGMWWLARQYRAQVLAEMKKDPSKINHAKLVAAQERLGRAYRDLLPYEKPRLESIPLKDPPARVQADLTRLSDAELDLLEKLCLKAQAGHTGGARPDVTLRQPSEPRRAATRR